MWRVEMSGFTSPTDPLGLEAHFCYWHALGQLSPPDIWHRVNTWQRKPAISGVQTFDVYTIWDGTNWNVEITIVATQPGVFGPRFKRWRKAFPAGFPSPWPDKILVVPFDEQPGWNRGGNNDQVVALGTYARIPADTCIGEQP